MTDSAENKLGTKSLSLATTSSLLPSTLSSTTASLVGPSTPLGTPVAAGASSVRTRSMTAAMAYRHSPAGAAYASPAVSRLIAMQKVGQSPRLDLLQETPPVFRHGRSIHSTPIGTPASSINCVGDVSWSAWGPESLFPDMCLEWIWSENSRRADAAVGERAAKAFITEDFLGNQFACFLCPKAKQLRCVKVNASAEGKIIAGGPVAAIPCIDAAPVDEEQMMVIVDDAHNLQAYTGLVKMGGVYISSTGLFGAWPTPRRESPESSSSTIGRRRQQPPMLSSSRAPSSIGASPFNEVSLSPVSQSSTPTDPPISGLVAEIERCVDRRLLMRLLTGVQCICRLAPLASNEFVLHCLHAVCLSLPKDKALKLCTQWYTCNNGQAINASVQSAVATELALLLHFLLDQMGLPLDSLQAFKKIERLRKLRNTSSARPKRSRRSDTGTVQDWEYLLSCDLLLTQKAEWDSMGLQWPSSSSDAGSAKNCAALDQHA
uniref:Anaphase-promoting complex subunit 1 middle domain-containing protein n=1 Tax=Plectus sambesii TaxID=2011161 RepID=A0A914WVH8_9BILA